MANAPQDDNQQPQPEAVVELLALARAERLDDLEAAWMAAVENPVLSLEDLQPVLDEIASRNNPKLMESLLWLLLSSRAESQGAEAALEIAWQVRDHLPDSQVMRDEIAGLYRKVYADLPGIATLAEITLLRRDVPLKRGVDLVEKFLALPPGTFVSDSRRKSPGRIIGVDAARKVLAVSFGETDRAYDALSVEALEVLEADDFRALAIFDKPKLAALAQDDPAELVRTVLRAYGPRMGMKDLRGRLADVAVAADAWSKWWSAAKAKVKRSPLIDMSEGTQPDFFLRQRAVTYEETARDRFDSARTVEEKLLVVLAYLGEAGHDPAAESAALESFAADLEHLAARPGAGTAEVLSALGVLAEVRRHVGGAALSVSESLLGDRAALAGVLGSIRSDDLARRAFALIREVMPADWPDVFSAAMPACSQEICEQIAADLSGAGRDDLLAAAAAAIIRQPHQCITALAWLWKTAGQGRYEKAFGGISLAQATVRLLAGVNEVALTPTDDRPRQLDLLAQVRRTISAKDFAILRDILDHTDSGWAKEIRAAASRNSGLTDHIRIQVLEVLGKAHPVPVTKIVPPWEEEAIYTTAAALEARQKEFEEVIHVKLPQNSAAIGAASALGDVSDNAEFQSALEERGRLTERANAMRADIVRAKPIPRIMAQSETVNIGTTVRARRLSTGKEETLTFLGPWDSAAEKGIYYYRAPMALAFMGKAVGETVTLRTDTAQEQWEILEIRPAI